MFGGWHLSVGGMEERVECPSWMTLVILLPISYCYGGGDLVWLDCSFSSFLWVDETRGLGGGGTSARILGPM